MTSATAPFPSSSHYVMQLASILSRYSLDEIAEALIKVTPGRDVVVLERMLSELRSKLAEASK